MLSWMCVMRAIVQVVLRRSLKELVVCAATTYMYIQRYLFTYVVIAYKQLMVEL